MAEKSLGKEFLELAIEIERNGYKFYELAAQDKGKEVRDILMQLAGREREQYRLPQPQHLLPGEDTRVSQTFDGTPFVTC